MKTIKEDDAPRGVYTYTATLFPDCLAVNNRGRAGGATYHYFGSNNETVRKNAARIAAEAASELIGTDWCFIGTERHFSFEVQKRREMWKRIEEHCNRLAGRYEPDGWVFIPDTNGQHKEYLTGVAYYE